MTIPDIAIIPKRCDKCRRRFWLEPMVQYYRIVGIGGELVKYTVCSRCAAKKKGG